MKNPRLPQVQQFHTEHSDNLYQSFPPSNNTRSSLKLVWSLQKAAASRDMISKKEVATLIAHAQAEERKLIGKELHDNVNQILTTVRLFIEMLEPVDTTNQEIKTKTYEYVGIAIEEIRKLSREMVSATQENKSLIDNIKQIIDDIRFSTALRIELKYNKSIEGLNPDKKITLLRIVQEQLKNVINYSKADLVKINLHSRGGTVTLTINDNGIGFDSHKSRRGIGISNITERVQSHEGTVNLQSTRGAGCTLSVMLPH